jgi:hypothetical protein
MPTDLEILMRRVERLERENLLFKRLGLAALVLIGAVLAIGQAGPPRTVEAESFLLKDVDGNVKAKLDSKDGITKLIFQDRAGHVRVALTSTESVEAFEMKDETGRLGATMSTGASTVGISSTMAVGAPLAGPVAGPGIVAQAWEEDTSLRTCTKGGHQIWEAPSFPANIRK